MRLSLFGLVLIALLGLHPAAWTADKDAPEGFMALFNGKDLTGWQVNKEGKMEAWGAENGILYVQGGGGGWLMTEKEFDNFELRLEFKLPERGNSGVAIRAALHGNPSFQTGMEIQLIDDEWHEKNYPGFKPAQHCGSIYGIVPPAKEAKEATKPIGEWNQMRIVAKGRQITVDLNKVNIVNANLDDYKQFEKEHPGMNREKGHLGLQSHDGRVEFRNIYVKPL